MTTHHFHVANMYTRSCIQWIQSELASFKGIIHMEVKLGRIEVIANDQWNATEFEKKLQSMGFPMTIDPDLILCEQVKLAAIELIMQANNQSSLIRNSDYISDKCLQSYEKISRVFSRVHGITLEKYIIFLKIERAKALICGQEFSLSEIAYMLGYSSVQYLSNQFKKITGYTVSEYKQLSDPPRIPLEDIIHHPAYRKITHDIS